MKKNHLFCVLLSLTTAFVFAGCSPGSPENPENPENPTPDDPSIVVVSLRAGGEINHSQEPLTRAGTNDLYALNVYQTINQVDNGAQINFTRYAYGYFDDLAGATLKLVKDRYYHFELAYIPDGKSKVHQFPDGHYGNPCASLFEAANNGKLNEMIYSNAAQIDMIGNGATQGKGIADYMIQSNMFNTIERYQGIAVNFQATDSSNTATIDLYRMMTGIKIIADDFTEGTISVSTKYGIKHSIRPSASSTTGVLDVTVEMPLMPVVGNGFNMSNDYSATKLFSDELRFALYVTYTGPDNKTISLYANEQFVYKRMTKHVLQFSVSDAIANGGISPNIKDDPNGELTEGGWTW